MKYATIRVFNERGYETETCIVYCESELQERIKYYVNKGYTMNGRGRHIEIGG